MYKVTNGSDVAIATEEYIFFHQKEQLQHVGSHYDAHNSGACLLTRNL